MVRRRDKEVVVEQLEEELSHQIANRGESQEVRGSMKKGLAWWLVPSNFQRYRERYR